MRDKINSWIRDWVSNSGFWNKSSPDCKKQRISSIWWEVTRENVRTRSPNCRPSLENPTGLTQSYVLNIRNSMISRLGTRNWKAQWENYVIPKQNCTITKIKSIFWLNNLKGWTTLSETNPKITIEQSFPFEISKNRCRIYVDTNLKLLTPRKQLPAWIWTFKDWRSKVQNGKISTAIWNKNTNNWNPTVTSRCSRRIKSVQLSEPRHLNTKKWGQSTTNCRMTALEPSKSRIVISSYRYSIDNSEQNCHHVNWIRKSR